MGTTRKSFLWYVYPPFLLIIVASLIAMSLYASSTFRRLYVAQLVDDLTLVAATGSIRVQQLAESEGAPSYDQLIKTVGAFPGRRLTIVDDAGVVLADSHESPRIMENHSTRTEIKQALAGDVGHSERFSTTLKEQMLYVAYPVTIGDSVAYVVRMGIPLTSIDAALRTLNLNILLAGSLVSLLAGAVSWILARRVGRRLKEMQLGAERFARGHLSFRLQMPRSQELSRLAGAMNTMAGQLDERIRTIVAQRNQLDAVLSSMSEAVVAFDLQEHILFINTAAERLFQLQPLAVQGRTVTESIRSSQFQQIVRALIESRESLAGDIVAGPERQRRLEVRGNLLHDEGGVIIGGLVVLNDVTELRRLENIRKDFVANVSHELRTPITSIKGFVETLLSKPLDDKQNIRRFLEIVQRHADRLSMIIEDLLSLSRIEQQADSEQISTELSKISGIIDSAIHACEQNAIQKHIKVERSCREDLRGQVAPSLLEQALVNLIDNAIKYSEELSIVRVEAYETDSEIVLAVHDSGCGISREHLDRLFERFYRIDKARSRKVGGTGLGLSIVKHIAQAMGGYPTVSSTVGKGSTFEIHLPRFVGDENK